MKDERIHLLEVLAEQFAIKKHADQKYGDKPYSYHLEKVVEVLKRFGEEESFMLVSAWLHDVIEDTPVTKEEVKKEFGEDVANLVWLVTNRSGKNRKERAKKTYPIIRSNSYAVKLKLADRIANVEESFVNNRGLFEMYKKEYNDFKMSLKKEKRWDFMWETLDKLLK